MKLQKCTSDVQSRKWVPVLICSVLAQLAIAPNAIAQDTPVESPQNKQQDKQDDPNLVVPRPAVKPSRTTMSGSLGEIFAQINTQAPNRRAGYKASMLKRIQRVVPTVVVVQDAQSYLFAISEWEGFMRFPVLWDDGTMESHEHIARFVRAFEPEHVIEIQSTFDPSWNEERTTRERVFEKALSKSIDENVKTWNESLIQLREQGVASPGIVITDTTDPAWPGALALAAGRLQPVAFVQAPSSVTQLLSPLNADGLERDIERAARLTGLKWEEIGDDIDAITLALNTGTTIKTGNDPRDRIATTDRIGRREMNGSGQRWAFTGQIIGNESRSVYQAMCALFLSIDEAFVWDGYDSSQPWVIYDGTAAAAALNKAEIKTELHDQPKHTLADWKLRMVRPIGSAGFGPDHKQGSSMLMLMNSKGDAPLFELPGSVKGQGKAGHMPMLNIPAALHIVHSFSLQTPTRRSTVGGRLIERGVYVYAGSVDEPFLSAFVPTPSIANRLAASIPFASAVRFDDGEVWKITVLGDPLVTNGPAGPRIVAKIDPPGHIDVETRSKEQLKAKDYLGSIRDLARLGKDSSVGRIAKALMKDQPGSFGSQEAFMSIPSLFRIGEYTTLLDAYERLDNAESSDPFMRDLLWLSSPYLLARSANDPEEQSRLYAMLRANIRDDQKIQDAEDLAMSMRRTSLASAVGILEALRPTLNERQARELDKAIARVRK
jgi:hypothetical protein